LDLQRNDKASWTQQLLLLQDITRRFGFVHEAQQQQIKLWPYAVDPAVVGAECDVSTEQKRMVYRWADPKKPAGWTPKGSYLKRLTSLANTVKRVLFGADWYFEVQMNGATIYMSPPGVVDENPQSSRVKARVRSQQRDRKSARKRSSGARRKQRR
jgi:hypothetical protein